MLVAVAAAAGGYLDWMWWHPTNGGTISFSGLAVSEGQVGAVLGSDREVSGSIEWSCPG